MPHSAPVLGGPGILLAGVITFAIVVSLATIPYGIWALRRRLRKRTVHKNEHILDPPRRSFNSEGLELGNVFRKSDATEHDPFVILPHNLSSYLPTTPPRARVSGSSPFTPPGLPPCKVSESPRTPVLVVTNTRQSVTVHLENAESFVSIKHLVQHQEKTCELESSAEDILRSKTTIECLGLGLMLSEETDPEISNRIAHSELEKRNTMDFVTAISQGHVVSSSSETIYPSPPATPALPTLVITSASMRRGLLSDTRRKGRDQRASAPTLPAVVLTSPSIHCGIDIDTEELLGPWKDEVQDWDDSLDLDNYESGENLVSQWSPVGIPKQLETPPQTPTFLRTPLSWDCAHAPPLSIDEEHPLVSWPTEEQTDFGEEGCLPDYTIFQARLVAFNVTHKRFKIARHVVGERQSYNIAAQYSPSCIFNFDYEKLLAKRKGTNVLTNSRPLGTQPLNIQLPVPVRRAARARPLGPRPGYI